MDGFTGLQWSHVDEKPMRVRVMRFENYPELFDRGHRFIFRAKETSAYQSRIAFSGIRLAECQANGRCFETQRKSSCDDRRSVVNLIFFKFTTIIKRVTNFPYNLQVRYLKIIEKSGYQALPWVRYITQNGGT